MSNLMDSQKQLPKLSIVQEPIHKQRKYILQQQRRTTGQVLKELKNTVYRPRCVIVGSRTQYCINPMVKNLPSNQHIMACKKLCKDDRCRFHNNQDLDPLEIWTVAGSNENRICDIEDLCNYGQCHNVLLFADSRIHRRVLIF